MIGVVCATELVYALLQVPKDHHLMLMISLWICTEDYLTNINLDDTKLYSEDDNLSNGHKTWTF